MKLNGVLAPTLDAYFIKRRTGQAYSSTDRRKDWTGAIAFPFSSHVGFLEAQAILRAPVYLK
jgi:hypothetical protein